MGLSHTKMAAAQHHAEFFSDDPDTKVGVVITRGNEELLRDSNRLPERISSAGHSRTQRPDKYLWIGHAEQAAIAQAAQDGIALSGARMYVTLFPCYICAGLIINAGIGRVISRHPDYDARPEAKYEIAETLFKEAGVEVFYVD